MRNVDSLWVFLIQLLVIGRCVSYEVPVVTIQALDPRGLTVSIPDAPGISSVEFSSIINGRSQEAEQTHAYNGRWTLTLPDVLLNDGDVVDYRVYVTLNDDDTYLRDGLRYTVHGKQIATAPPRPATTTSTTTTTTSPPPTVPSPDMPRIGAQPPRPTQCQRSVTTVKGQARFCVGEVIFEDHFNGVLEDRWQFEHKIPINHPEYPFVTYQQSQVHVYKVRNQGLLVIEPKPQVLMPNFHREKIFEGIDLGPNCTGHQAECQWRTDGADIVRPVASGRITTRNFAFKYGRVDVQAKLPQGDWLYPELLLEEASPWSKFNGFMKIASVRGNKQIGNNYGEEFGSEILYGGVSYSPQCKKRVFSKRQPLVTTNWPDAFHTYSLLWTPTGITLMVDGEMMGPELTPPFQGATCDPRKRSSEMSPFDREYKLSFGVAAGGISEFGDGWRSVELNANIFTLQKKPWKNNGRKAMLDFFNAQSRWLPTWEGNSDLQIRYVRVTAM